MRAREMQACKWAARWRAAGRGRTRTLVVIASTAAILCAMAGAAVALEAGKRSASATTRASAAAHVGYPSLGRIDFDGDFDAGCRLMGGAGGWGRDFIESGGNGRIVRTVVGEGRCSAQLTSVGRDGRAELAARSSKGGPDPHVVYEGLYRVPHGTDSIGNFTQHKQGPPDSEGCYNGGLKNRSGRILLVTVHRCTEPQSRGQRRFNLGPMPRGHWFAVKVQLRFSNNPRVGFARAWIDPDGPGRRGYQVRLRRVGVDAESGDRNGARVGFRTGTYHAGTSGNHTVYVDGWHMMCVTHC